MKIYGAGMAGLIAAHMFRRHNPVVYEIQDNLPNNHAALLRFRTDAISRITGIPFKKVQVRKNIFHARKIWDSCNIQIANLYSQKVSSAIEARSIWNLDPVERYIAPSNFVEQLAAGLDIKYGCGLTCEKLDFIRSGKLNTPIVSTIPMPKLMYLADWPNPDCKHSPIFSITADIKIPCEVYQTIYFPDDNTDMYRASITGNHFIAEFMNPVNMSDAEALATVLIALENFFGIYLEEKDLFNLQIKAQHYGKILNDCLPETQAFIMAMTEKYGIYSLGRFGTWRQLLLDDMVNDCNVIERLITTKDTYESKLR